MSLFKHQCSWPGCEKSGKLSRSQYARYGFVAGKCSRHGSWAGCERHTRGYGYRGIGDPQSARSAPGSARRLRIRWRQPGEMLPRGRPKSATSRSTWQSSAPRDMGKLQRKLLLLNGSLKRAPAREWSSNAIKQERDLAEFQRKRRAGEVGRCPACNMYAPISEGVILGHTTTDSSLEPSGCGGVGMLAEVSKS